MKNPKWLAQIAPVPRPSPDRSAPFAVFELERRFATTLLVSVIVLLTAACTPTVSTTSPPRPSDASVPAATAAAASATVAVTADPCAATRRLVISLERADTRMRAIAAATDLSETKAAAKDVDSVLRAILPGDSDGPPTGALVDVVKAGRSDARELDEVALGGLPSWADPRVRWAEWRQVLSEWHPVRNTMPRLASHLLRALGWAQLVMDAGDLRAARELASVHGQVHTRLSLDAARAHADSTRCG